MNKYEERIYKKYNGKGIEDDGGVKSEDFKKFASYMKRQFKESAKTYGLELEKFSVGHYFISGFFVKDENHVVYFNWDCPRGNMPIDFHARDCIDGFLYRKAKNTNDYHGEQNHFCSLADGFMSHVASLL